MSDGKRKFQLFFYPIINVIKINITKRARNARTRCNILKRNKLFIKNC